MEGIAKYNTFSTRTTKRRIQEVKIRLLGKLQVGAGKNASNCA
jgi:hypothetical protein